MATEKQSAANRANALRSTGPKTAAGKARSSRNALRHGLSLSIAQDESIRRQLDAVALGLAQQCAVQQPSEVLTELAQAQLGLQRVRKVQAAMMAGLDAAIADSKHLCRLLALDRYERRALTKRRRAGKKIVNP